jgi:hypothetical protein
MAVSPLDLHAQKLSLGASPVENDGLNYLKIIGQDEDGFFVLFSNLSLNIERDRIGLRTRKYWLGYYTFDLKPKWQKALEGNDNAGIETVNYFNNRIVVISSTSDKSAGTLQLFLNTYDASGNAIIAGRKISSLNVDRSSDPGKPRMRISPNRERLGIILNEERENEQILHSVFCDTSFNVIGSSTAKLSYSPRDLDLTEAVISDDHQLILLGQLRIKDAAADRKKTQLFKLFYLAGGGASFREFPVNTIQETMSEANLIIDRKHQTALVTGFYAEQESFAGTGILYGKLQLSGPDSFKVAALPIRSDSNQQLVGERNNSNGVGLFNYPVQKIIPRNDGGAVIVAEAAYLSEYSYYDYFTQSFNRRIEYHFDNIVVMSINARGNIDWSEVIRKDQTSMDDEGYYSSFCGMYDFDRMALIFNDDVGRNNIVVAHIIDNLGRLQVKKLSSISDNITIIPRSGKQVAESLVIVPATSRKRLYLARIEF